MKPALSRSREDKRMSGRNEPNQRRLVGRILAGTAGLLAGLIVLIPQAVPAAPAPYEFLAGEQAVTAKIPPAEGNGENRPAPTVRFRAALENLRAARDAWPVGSAAYDQLKRALAMYGQENDNNGVFVAFAVSGRSHFVVSMRWVNGRQLYGGGRVTLNTSDIDARSVAHEGVHMLNAARALEPETYGAPTFDLYGPYGRYYDELTAYHASVLVAAASGADRMTIRANGRQWVLWTRQDGWLIDNLDAHLRAPRAAGGYGLTRIPPPDEVRRFIREQRLLVSPPTNSGS